MAVAVALCADGAPSRMRPVTAIDPDGNPVVVTAVGDEHHHHYVDQWGNRVTWLPSADRPKTTPAMRSRGLATAPSRLTAFPTKGEIPFLIVLVDFPDKGFRYDDPKEEFEAMLSERGFSRYNGRGSALDYFIDNSDGAFSPVFEVTGPVTMSRPYAYYGSGSDDSAAGLMVIEACNALDATVDFSRYDADGDGSVDNVYFFYAGRGEADGGDADTIWPHAWTLTEQGRELTLDGKRIDAYACSPELDGRDKPNGIGTFCHEFSHILGLPDLYSTGYTNALHPDSWSLMASGNYNEDGRRPPNLSSYERYELGWMTPRELSYPLTVELPTIASNMACRISTDRPNEYFLLENRQKEGWDASLPGHGMLIWHIDYNPNIWDRNVVNNTPSHQYVDIVEANNATSHSQDSGFPFPGSNNVTSFTSETRPALKSWEGVGIDLPITSIREDGAGMIHFDVAGGKTPVGAVASVVLDEVGMEWASLSWSAAEAAERYRVSITSTDGKAPYGNVVETTETSVTLDGLWPGRTYIAEVCGQDRYEQGGSAMLEIVMPAPDFAHSYPEIFPATEVTGSGFTANWKGVEEATSYLLTVGEVITTESEPLWFGFDGLVLPDGWEMDGCAWSSIEGYYGTSAPSLRMSGESASLTTSVFDHDIATLEFYLKGSSNSAGSRLAVAGQDSAGEEILLEEVDLDPEARRIVLEIESRGIRSLGFFLRPAKNNVIAYFDDLSITLCERSISVLPEWDKTDVGSSTSYRVTPLRSNVLYCFQIQAMRNGEEGLSSDVEFVTTSGSAYIPTLSVKQSGEVDVYSSQGILLRKNVDAENATEGLSPGVYIIEGRKVLIR